MKVKKAGRVKKWNKDLEGLCDIHFSILKPIRIFNEENSVTKKRTHTVAYSMVFSFVA